jgi:hypothetical protein
MPATDSQVAANLANIIKPSKRDFRRTDKEINLDKMISRIS